MVVDYTESKIYKLVSCHTDKVYIGSTTQLLSRRKQRHVCCLKKNKITCSSSEIISLGPDDCQIVLIESYPCSTKEELLLRERYWIENTNCVNKKIPIRSKEESAQLALEYRIRDKEKIYARKKELVDCEICCCSIRRDNIHHHVNSLKHQKNAEIYISFNG